MVQQKRTRLLPDAQLHDVLLILSSTFRRDTLGFRTFMVSRIQNSYEQHFSSSISRADVYGPTGVAASSCLVLRGNHWPLTRFLVLSYAKQSPHIRTFNVVQQLLLCDEL
jgi:hypothetical protein